MNIKNKNFEALLKKKYIGVNKLKILNSFPNEDLVLIDDNSIGYKIGSNLIKNQVFFLLFNDDSACEGAFIREFYFFQKIKL